MDLLEEGLQKRPACSRQWRLMGRPVDSREWEVKLLRGYSLGKEAVPTENLTVHEAIKQEFGGE